MKKRYSKLFAYLLTSSTLGIVTMPLGVLEFISSGEKRGSIIFIIMWIICILLTVLMTKSLNKRTPKDERLATWFRAWLQGCKIAFKLALTVTIIFLPVAKMFNTDISEKDVYFWEDGDRVFGDDGKEYTVSGFGSFINDGMNLKKIHTLNGEPYFEDGLNKIWLRSKQ